MWLQPCPAGLVRLEPPWATPCLGMAAQIIRSYSKKNKLICLSKPANQLLFSPKSSQGEPSFRHLVARLPLPHIGV